MRPLSREQIAWRAARDLPDGAYVNLGIGMPVRVAAYTPPGREVMFQSENGVLGVGPVAAEDAADPDLVDAGSQRITLVPGASTFDSAEAFAMIRGGHLDVTLLGAFQVSAAGDLANWDPLRTDKGPLLGGAMDLAMGARSVRIMMQHTTRDGLPRLVETCSYPLTARQVVRRVYTDLAVVEVTERGFLVTEIIAGLSREELAVRTGAPLQFADGCAVLAAPDLA